MKALSIRQPWAWLIVRPDLIGPARVQASTKGLLKDTENRTWPTRFRGEFWIHAAQGMTKAEYESTAEYLFWIGASEHIALPAASELQRGGIVGRAQLIDCISPSMQDTGLPLNWHMSGCFGFKLANTVPVDFRPCKGRLGFYEVVDGPV